MQALRTTELGFNAENLVTMQAELAEFRYNAGQWSVIYRELVDGAHRRRPLHDRGAADVGRLGGITS